MLMKKILLLMCLMICSFTTYSWSTTIYGSKSVTINTKVRYEIRLSAPASETISFKTKVTGGVLSSGSQVIPEGSSFVYIDIFWNEARSDGKIELKFTTGDIISLSNIVIKDANNEIPLPKMNIIGPDSLFLLEPTTYRLIGYDNSVTSVKWEDGKKSLFYKNTTGYQTSVTAIQASPIGITGLIAVINDKFISSNLVIKNIKIIEPSLTKSTSIICENQIISYTLKNYYPNATVTWQAGSNLTLVSGQGTSTATFKGSGNGKGVVKATVSYDGVSYPIENSDVWVGPPMAASGIGFIPNDPIIEMPQETPEYLCINKAFSNKNYIYSQITGGDLISNTEYQWIKKTNNFNLASTTFSKAMVVPTAKGDMIIEYTTKNKCGSMAGPIKYIIKATECDLNGNPINSGGGGGVITPPDDFIPMSRSSVEPQPTSIRIYSYPTGSLVYQKKNTISFDIQSTNLGEGIYIL